MKLRMGRNMHPKRAFPARPYWSSPTTIEQLSLEEADKVGRAAYYGSNDCANGRGGVIGWEHLTRERKDYYIGIAAVVLTVDAEIRGHIIVPRSDDK
ncbi:hypothetical protein [Amycolatopsis pittospori]|uniref:hypothetical protein n=1 Tax=Amycolatopsis pittospori TaxID=2749434 RepID=UPI0015F085BF|nr:hypothetical protein [Amycolatopsis pittospori]